MDPCSLYGTENCFDFNCDDKINQPKCSFNRNSQYKIVSSYKTVCAKCTYQFAAHIK